MRNRRRRAQRPIPAEKARRAIYYDFERRAVDGVPPLLLGACWLNDPADEESLVFRQYIVDPVYRDLERLDRGPVATTLEDATARLIAESVRGRRHLVSWSNYDADVIRTFTEHRAFRHRNGIVTARRWRRGRTSLGPDHSKVDFSKRNRLQSYLQLIGYDVPPDVREGAGDWMTTIQARMAGARYDIDRLSQGGREAWTNLVAHNRHDVLGLREIILVATGVREPRV